MPAAIPWEEDELHTLVSNPDSQVFLDQKRISVVLQPFHLQDLKSAVRDLLNASIDCYDKSLDGILLSYKHLKILSKSASVAAETSGVLLEIQADFYVFRPEIGCTLKGIVNKISKDHVGVLLYHRFNVSCPRPSSEAKSKKWIGSNVVMHQEVIFKLKDKNFSGTLPFFLGKIMDIGMVITESMKGEDKKSLKKKNKEGTLEKSVTSETSETSVTVSKKRKLKLDESDQILEVKPKKSKKDTSNDHVKKHTEENADIVQAELSVTKKKKKKMSIGHTGETDFIPRFSLDVSQLPEQLPPPNADSTHFDLKNLSGVSSKVEKKKKVKSAGLGSIGEELSEGLRGTSKANSRSEISEVNTPKKLQADFSHNQHNAKTQPSSFNHEVVKEISKSLQESSKKKKHKMIDSVCEEQSTSLKTMKLTASSNPVQSAPPTSPNKKHKAQESLPKMEETVPKKGKKANVSKQIEQESQEALHKASFLTKVDSQSPSKSKKKSKEDQFYTAPAKPEKIKKEKIADSVAKSEMASDDTIPPGQKSVRESPQKGHKLVSPQKEQSLSSVSIAKSPGIGYFAASTSMMDLDFSSSRKGARPAPLMFGVGNLEKKILPPPESPMKSPPVKNARNHDSDSDTPLPKRVIVSSSVRQGSSDSSDSESQCKPKLNKKANLALKQGKGNSDDSDSDASVKRLLQSMGVMQSPLKSAKPNVKHDTESESEGSSDVEDKNIISHQLKAPATDKFSDENNSNHKLTKPILAAKIKTKPEFTERARGLSSKKSANTISDSTKTLKYAKQSPSKVKGSSHSLVQPEDSDSDSDLETMKAAMLKIEEERLTGAAPKQNPKSKVKAPKSNLESDSVVSKKAQIVTEKKTTLKPVEKAPQNAFKVPTKDSKSLSLPKNPRYASSDDDSDSELIKAAFLKAEEENVTGGASKKNPKSKLKPSKSNTESNDTSSKKAQAVSKIKPSPKTNNKVPQNTPKGNSKTEGSLSKLAGADSSADDASDLELMKAVMSKVKEEQSTSGTSKPKSKSKRGKSKADVLSNNTLASPVQKAGYNISLNVGKSTSKVFSGPSHDAGGSGGDTSDSDLIKAVMSRINEEQIAGGKPKSKSKTKQVKSRVESVDISSRKNISSISNDSDSGPDDRNTTDIMEEMRQKRADGELAKKKKSSVKQTESTASEMLIQLKGGSKEEGFESINGTVSRKKIDSKNQKVLEMIKRDKPSKQKAVDLDSKNVSNETKKSKGSKGSAKISAGQESIPDKKASKGKKKGSTDDEISDVMQRLLRQAQLSVGLA